MIDYTFDIANEYLSKLKLSNNHINEIYQIYKSEVEKHDKQLFDQDQQLLDQSLEDISKIGDFEIPYTPVGESIDGHGNDKKTNVDPKIITRIKKQVEKYLKDKRLCYSNNNYYNSVFEVAFNNLIEKHISKDVTAYEIASMVVEENRKLIIGNDFEKYENTIYPKIVYDEFKRRIEVLNKDFYWHRDSDGGLFSIITTAYHYGQEIPEEYICIPMSRLDSFFRKKYFINFFNIYTIIPFLIQEIGFIILLFTAFGGDGISFSEELLKYKNWIEKNHERYVSFMLFIATVFWMWIFK